MNPSEISNQSKPEKFKAEWRAVAEQVRIGNRSPEIDAVCRTALPRLIDGYEQRGTEIARLIDEVEAGRREINKLNSRVLESQQHILTIVDKIAEQELRALGAEDALREAQARIETLRETADRATVRAGEAQGEVEQFKGNCSCTDHDPQACLNGEVDEEQRHCHCECHSVKGE